MSQHTPAPSRSPGRIAIVGMGCRLPGDVDSPAALWRLLADGRDAVAEPPAERAALWAADPSTAARPESAPPVRGGYLRDVSGFDADFFGVSGREADILDPSTGYCSKWPGRPWNTPECHPTGSAPPPPASSPGSATTTT
ncbi:hypothetical protein GCM10017744_014600 [Streptomyces antimycoticus]